MVGVPRSSGCRICVQRRVRCDGARPTCNNCRKGNRPCPGYGPGVKFQDEGPRLREKYHKTQKPIDSTADSDDSSFAWALTPSSSDSPSSKHWDVIGLDADGPSTPKRFNLFEVVEGRTQAYESFDPQRDLAGKVEYFVDLFTMPLISPEITQMQLLANFAHAITPSDRVAFLPKPMKPQGTWLARLPEISGTSLLLDSAIRAVTLVHLGRIQKSEVFIHESRPYYGKALRLLNHAIHDEEMGMDGRTLCATILLSFYEMFASDRDSMWVRHAGGAATLMRIRGAKRHRYGLDRDVFLAYRFTLIIESFTNDTPCFLAEPEWVQLAKDIYSDILNSGQMPPERKGVFDAVEDYAHEMAKISVTSAEANKRIMKIEQTGSCDDDDVSLIVCQLQDHYTVLMEIEKRWRDQLRMMKLTPPLEPSGDPVIPFQYNYSNTFIASLTTGMLSVLMLVNATIKPLALYLGLDVQRHQTRNEKHAIEACYSVEFMIKSSFLGPFFMIYALRFVFRIFPHGDIRSDWALCKLIEIGDKRMQFAKAPIGGEFGGAWENPETFYQGARRRLEQYGAAHRAQQSAEKNMPIR